MKYFLTNDTKQHIIIWNMESVATKQSMKCFKIVRDVLEEIYPEIPADTENEKDALIKQKMQAIALAYQNLRTENTLEHADVTSQFSYIYKYITSHANIIFQLIRNSAELQNLFDREEIDVACIGGGPGSEILGILKYLELSGQNPYLTCQLFDKEKSWSERWSDVGKKVSRNLRFHTSFESIDIFEESDWIKKKKFLDSDLFTVVFILSEVFNKKELAEPFFKNLFENAKSGSLFVYIDNNDRDGEFHGWFDSMVADAGLETILNQSKFEPIYDFNEDKKFLGRFWDKFGAEFSPKLKANIAIRVCRKN